MTKTLNTFPSKSSDSIGSWMMTPMFPQRCTTDKKDLLCADDQQIFTSQVTFQSSSCKFSEPTRLGFSSGFSSQNSWVNEVRGIKPMFYIRLKLLCTFVIIIDVVKTIHRWGFDISILKYIWDLKCFKLNNNHVQGVNHCMRASTTPSLILGQPSRANKVPRSCQLGKYDYGMKLKCSLKCSHRRLESK